MVLSIGKEVRFEHDWQKEKRPQLARESRFGEGEGGRGKCMLHNGKLLKSISNIALRAVAPYSSLNAEPLLAGMFGPWPMRFLKPNIDNDRFGGLRQGQ
jgi:hypothetical protein